MKKNAYRIGFTICLIAFFAICSVMGYQYINRKNAEEKLEQVVESTRIDTSIAEKEVSVTEEPVDISEPSVVSTPEIPEETQPRDVLAERGITIPEKNIDWEELKSENPDIYAWIYIPGTNVDYPILQHPDEKSYYLDHNIDGSEGYPGCIYTQNVNSKDWMDPNTVIYGHNMNDGSMFHDLHKFEDNAFFDENSLCLYILLRGTKRMRYLQVILSAM